MQHAKDPTPRPRRWRLVLGLGAALVVIVGGVLVALGRDRGTSDAGADTADTAPTTAEVTTTVPPDPYAVYRTAGWVAEENARPGTTDWIVPDEAPVWEKIRGYADATSIDLGEEVVVRVSTRAPTWTLTAYRLGFYGTTGGRMIWRSEPQPGVDQPAAVQADPATRTWTAPWAPSMTLRTDPTWPPGQYVLRLDSSDGGATWIPLVVRDDESRSDLLIQSAVTTWQAYNGWGGASLYQGNDGRADVVSFDRPYTGNGTGELFGREFEFLYFVEQLGLDVTYWTDIDLHQRGELATNHRAIVIPGHDEYYTVEMRRNLEAARDAGVNLGFFGANNVYRRIRLEPSPSGVPARHEVNYRDASRDPLNGIDPERVTTSFREPPAANPESSLIGNYYECNPVAADWVVADASAWMFEGSGFVNGERVPGMVGNEYDRVTAGVPTPANIQVIAHSPVDCKGLRSHADSTWYSAPSGAGVFSAGTFGWSPLLQVVCPAGPPTTSQCKVAKVTENLLRAFAAGPAGAAHPSRPNLAELGIAGP